MLVVKFEVWKYGDPEQVIPLGVMLIKNAGFSAGADPDEFVYDVEFRGDDYVVAKRTRLHHWRRRGWKVLVRKAVEAMMH